MEPIKIIQSMEDLVFEVALWPRAMLALLVRATVMPWWVRRYVDEEWKKDQSARFKAYMPPILFWFFVVVLPYFFLMNHLIQAATVRFPTLSFINAWSWPVKFFLTALLLAGGPLNVSRTLLRRRSPDERDTLKRCFSTQCVCLTPSYLVLLLGLVLTSFAGPLPKTAQEIWLWIFVIFFAYAEIGSLWPELWGDSSGNWLAKIDTFFKCIVWGWGEALGIMFVVASIIALAQGDIPAKTNPPTASHAANLRTQAD